VGFGGTVPGGKKKERKKIFLSTGTFGESAFNGHDQMDLKFIFLVGQEGPNLQQSWGVVGGGPPSNSLAHTGKR